jgi:hypothetical protein
MSTYRILSKLVSNWVAFNWFAESVFQYLLRLSSGPPLPVSLFSPFLTPLPRLRGIFLLSIVDV